MTTSRISLPKAARAVYRAIDALDSSAEFEPRLRELVRIRASQINGCAFCVDMHSVDARKAGEHDRRIFALAAWHESPFFDERERAALALTEAMTRLPEGGVADEVYERAAARVRRGGARQPHGRDHRHQRLESRRRRHGAPAAGARMSADDRSWHGARPPRAARRRRPG